MKWISVFTTWLNMLSKSALVLLSPLVLSIDSQDQKEFWFLLLALNSLILMLDLGMLGNGTRWVALMSNKYNVVQIDSFIHRTYRPLFFFSFILCAIISIVYFVIYRGINNANAILLIVSSILIPISLRNNSKIALLQGFNLVARVQLMLSCVNLLFLVATSLILFFFENIFLAFAVLNLSHLINYFVLHKMYENFANIGRARCTNEILVEDRNHLIKSSKETVLGLFTTTIFFNIVPFLLVEIYGEYKIVSLLFTLQILKAVSAFSHAPISAKIPYLSILFTTGKFFKLEREQFRFYFMSIAVYVSGALAVYLLSYNRHFSLDNKLDLALFPLVAVALGVERMLNAMLHSLTVYRVILWQWINPLLVLSILVSWFFIKTIEGYFISLFVAYLFIGLPFVLLAGRDTSKFFTKRAALLFTLPFLIFVLYVFKGF